MLSFHDDPAIKDNYLKRAEAIQLARQIERKLAASEKEQDDLIEQVRSLEHDLATKDAEIAALKAGQDSQKEGRLLVALLVDQYGGDVVYIDRATMEKLPSLDKLTVEASDQLSGGKIVRLIRSQP